MPGAAARIGPREIGRRRSPIKRDDASSSAEPAMPQDPLKLDPVLLARIAEALERLAPPPPAAIALGAADAFVWHAETGRLTPVPETARVDIALLAGIGRQRDQLLANTSRFAHGLPANNVLLWG